MVNYYTTIQSILNYTRMFFDILIMWLLLYYTIKIVRNNSRTIQIFKGIVLILVIKAVANVFGLNTVGWIADHVCVVGLHRRHYYFPAGNSVAVGKAGKIQCFFTYFHPFRKREGASGRRAGQSRHDFVQGSDRSADFIGTVPFLKRLCQNRNADEFDGHRRTADLDFCDIHRRC